MEILSGTELFCPFCGIISNDKMKKEAKNFLENYENSPKINLTKNIFRVKLYLDSRQVS